MPTATRAEERRIGKSTLNRLVQPRSRAGRLDANERILNASPSRHRFPGNNRKGEKSVGQLLRLCPLRASPQRVALKKCLKHGSMCRKASLHFFQKYTHTSAPTPDTTCIRKQQICPVFFSPPAGKHGDKRRKG